MPVLHGMIEPSSLICVFDKASEVRVFRPEVAMSALVPVWTGVSLLVVVGISVM